MDSDPTQRGPWASRKASFPDSRTQNFLNPRSKGSLEIKQSGSGLLGPLAAVPGPARLRLERISEKCYHFRAQDPRQLNQTGNRLRRGLMHALLPPLPQHHPGSLHHPYPALS